MNWTITTAATTHEITATQAKAHLHIANSDEDTDIGDMLDMVSEILFKEASCTWAESTVKGYTDEWDDFVIPFGPVSAVVIKYYNSSNVLTTLTEGYTDDYKVNYKALHPKITMINTPTLYDREDAIEITITTGPDDSQPVPALVESAARFIIGDLYEFRQSGVMGVSYNELNRSTKHAISLISRRREI